MNFNFNFPDVRFTDEIDHKSVLLVPYHLDEEKIIIDKEINKKYKKLVKGLSKDTNNIFPVFVEDRFLVFVNVNKESFEQSIVSALKSVPENFASISVLLGDYDFYDKLLVSKIVFELKDSWNLKTKKNKEDNKIGRKVYLVVKNISKYSEFLGRILGETQALVQQLVNMPSNQLTPTNFNTFIERKIVEYGLKNIELECLGIKEIQKLKMGSFLGVAKGSEEEPKLIVFKYDGALSKDKPIVLVGKGLTFDSGGISIKPSNGMADMKGDMAGAATALSAVIYAARAKLPINLVAIAACCENMPSGRSVKPGDVLTAMDGTTIEVVDTDAEGRLVLADALVFSQKFNGKYTIDMATLTGACIVALGHVHTGLFSKDNNLAEKLLKSGKKIKDTAWQLPLDEAYEDMLDSKVADISNLCLGKGAGAQNGAIFLQRFAPKTGWCHLDIAGTSAAKGGSATSRPLALISEFLDKQ